jgi:peptidyl-prolyl cis-trans isomerase C
MRQFLEIKTRASFLLFMSLASSALLGCHARTPPQAQGEPIVARVGSRAISSTELKVRVSSNLPAGRTRVASLEEKKELLDRVIRSVLIVQEAERQGMAKDPEVVEAKEHHATEQQLDIKMANEFLHDKFDKDPALKQIPESEVRADYAAHQSDYVKPERVRLEVILLKGEPSDRKAHDEAKALLADLKLKAARGNGGSFATTARVRSEDGATQPRGGDTDFKTPEQLAQAYGPAVAQAARSLASVGDMSEPVRGATGWFLLKLMGRQNAMNQPFEEVAHIIEGRLRSEKRATLIDNFAKELRAHTDIVVNEDELNRTELEVASSDIHPSNDRPRDSR